ncbi:hypothetical protein [Xanthomonas graminis]|uniref:hypothetical protein n=1 Tax=Xanthomonas graminis TaxID=3390026 RepID=UPI001112F83E|nr:hypothetical protein [Xanthomonas translucens]
MDDASWSQVAIEWSARRIFIIAAFLFLPEERHHGNVFEISQIPQRRHRAGRIRCRIGQRAKH